MFLSEPVPLVLLFLGDTMTISLTLTEGQLEAKLDVSYLSGQRQAIETMYNDLLDAAAAEYFKAGKDDLAKHTRDIARGFKIKLNVLTADLTIARERDKV